MDGRFARSVDTPRTCTYTLRERFTVFHRAPAGSRCVLIDREVMRGLG